MNTPDYSHASPSVLRGAIGDGHFTGPTAGLAQGYVQCNVVILPEADADEFEDFCRQNSQACPLIDKTSPGDPTPLDAAFGADLRIHLPRYRIFRNGVPDVEEPYEIRQLWRKDFVGFLLGCSFTFERALMAASLPVRHLEQNRNVPMYCTNIACEPCGKFHGPLVVSMRPFAEDQVDRVRRITARYPKMHGPPIHAGDPRTIGVDDLNQPDFGDAVTVHDGEVPVFWACGVTPQLALENAKCELAITHSPGCMFISDLRDELFEESPDV